MSFTTGALKLSVLNPLTLLPVDDNGYDVAYSVVQVTNITNPYIGGTWSLQDVIPFNGTNAQFVPEPAFPNIPPVPGQASVFVQGDWGEVLIELTLPNGTMYAVDKKWGKIYGTDFDKTDQSVTISWNESAKEYNGLVKLTDTVTGIFYDEFNNPSLHPVQGVVLNWFLVAGYENVPMTPGEAPVLIKKIIGDPVTQTPGLDWPKWAEFEPYYPALVDSDIVGYDINSYPPYTAGLAIPVKTVTGPDGSSSIWINTDWEEIAKVVVIAQYPVLLSSGPQLPVTPEVATINFQTREMEAVPQVRWAGEKIVLEKNFFGPGDWAGYYVRFQVLSGDRRAVLEPCVPVPPGGESDAETVDAMIDAQGFARVILYSPVQGDIDVIAALYVPGNPNPINQHHFTVYYLKFLDLTLGDVSGKRVGHNLGLWTPENPWDTSTDNNTVDVVNVSQDALLRARVRGWFADADYTLWTLPDDWPALADPHWQQFNIHWDIMNDPSKYINANPAVPGSKPDISKVVSALDPLGPYYAPLHKSTPPFMAGPMVASALVVGPFSPGIEQAGASEIPPNLPYQVPNWKGDPLRPYQTVVPNRVLDGNNALNWWDCPMPPAKITFQTLDPSGLPLRDPSGHFVATDKAGFFKGAYKPDIYYGWWYNPAAPLDPPIRVYTNPFYQIMIPAHWAIPTVINNGGYDWDTFGNIDDSMGPYPFWKVLNRSTENPLVLPSTGDNPTLVQVYSDNHGEAMAYINGDWNLGLDAAAFNVYGGPYDIKTGTIVSTSTVEAMATYPYVRQPSASYKSILSNTVEKDWKWGKQILGPDPHTYNTGEVDDSIGANTIRMVFQAGHILPNGTSDSKMAMVWVTDRDGFAPVGEKVTWRNVGLTKVALGPIGISSVNDYNTIMQKILVDSGFLYGTGGTPNVPDASYYGTSYLIGIHPDPTKPDDWSMDNALAAVFYKFWNPTRDPAGLQPTSYAVGGIELVDSGQPSTDLEIATYEREGVITRDVVIDWKDADSPDDPFIAGDANYDGKISLADIILTERMMLSLSTGMTASDINADGKINILDILLMEKKMLGY
jgi:hypothetical protein